MAVPQNLMINVRAIIFQVQVIFIFMQVIVFKTLLAGQQIYPRWASAHYPHNLIYASIQDEPEKKIKIKIQFSLDRSLINWTVCHPYKE